MLAFALRYAHVIPFVLIAVWLGYQVGDSIGESRGHAAGYKDAIENMEAANRVAGRKAQEGEDNVARCYRSGGVWVRAAGTCDPPVRRD